MVAKALVVISILGLIFCGLATKALEDHERKRGYPLSANFWKLMNIAVWSIIFLLGISGNASIITFFFDCFS